LFSQLRSSLSRCRATPGLATAVAAVAGTVVGVWAAVEGGMLWAAVAAWAATPWAVAGVCIWEAQVVEFVLVWVVAIALGVLVGLVVGVLVGEVVFRLTRRL
jgi:hypothetical protein